MNTNKVVGVEVNGPAAIAMILEDVMSRTDMDRATRRDLDEAFKLALKTVEYIKLLENTHGVIWSEVK